MDKKNKIKMFVGGSLFGAAATFVGLYLLGNKCSKPDPEAKKIADEKVNEIIHSFEED